MSDWIIRISGKTSDREFTSSHRTQYDRNNLNKKMYDKIIQPQDTVRSQVDYRGEPLLLQFLHHSTDNLEWDIPFF
jgi:hypothetical protein